MCCYMVIYMHAVSDVDIWFECGCGCGSLCRKISNLNFTAAAAAMKWWLCVCAFYGPTSCLRDSAAKKRKEKKKCIRCSLTSMPLFPIVLCYSWCQAFVLDKEPCNFNVQLGVLFIYLSFCCCCCVDAIHKRIPATFFKRRISNCLRIASFFLDKAGQTIRHDHNKK